MTTYISLHCAAICRNHPPHDLAGRVIRITAQEPWTPPRESAFAADWLMFGLCLALSSGFPHAGSPILYLQEHVYHSGLSWTPRFVPRSRLPKNPTYRYLLPSACEPLECHQRRSLSAVGNQTFFLYDSRLTDRLSSGISEILPGSLIGTSTFSSVSPTSSASSSGSGSNTGAIAGDVVGGVIAIAATAGLVFVF